MALIKSSNTDQVMKDVIVLDLGDLRQQAETLKRKAKQDAQRIVEEGRSQAEQLTKTAEAEGHAAGQKAGYEKGYAEGQAAGHQAALEQTQQQLTELTQAWAGALQELDGSRRQILIDARTSLLELAMALAKKVVHRLPEVDPSIVVDQVAEAIQYVSRPSDVTIRIHPSDRSAVAEALPQVLQSVEQVQHAALVDDESVGVGGCVIRYGRGRIDATVDGQLNRLVKALLPSPEAEPEPDAASPSDEAGDTP